MKHKILLPFLVAISTLSAVAQEKPALYKTLEETHDSGQFEACIKLAGQMDSFAASRLDTDTIVANSYYFLADSYSQLGKTSEAILYWERERTMRAKIDNPDYYSICLYNLAAAYLQSGQYAKAGKIADELLVVDKKIYGEDSPEFASSAISISDTYIQIDRFRDAERLLNSVLKKQPKNTVAYGLLLNKLGDLYTYTSQFSKAATALQQATDILYLQAGEESGEYITAAISLGVLYMSQGKYPEAEEIFDVALSNLDPAGEAYANVMNNQAVVYRSLGQLDRSADTFAKIRALDSLSIGTSHPSYAITLSNLGQTLTLAGKYPQAEKAMLLALDIQKKNKDVNSVSYARKLNNLARVYQLSGKPDKAIPYFQQASAVFKKALTENSPEYATTMYNLGNAFWQSGNGKEGIKFLRSSASIRAKVLGKKHPRYAESIQKIAEYQWEQKQIKEAHQSFGEVFDNYYFQLDVTFPGLSEEEKSRFYYANIKDGFEKFNSFAVANASADPLLIGDVYNYHINTKGAIMYATEKVKQAISSSKDTVLINLFEKWQSQKEQIARAYSQNQDAGSLDSMVQSANIIEKELTRRSSAFAGQFTRKKYTWQDIQKTLKPGEACVEVMRYRNYNPEKGGAFTDGVSYAFIVIAPDSKAPELIIVNRGNDMEGKFLKFYHNSIRYNLDDTYSFKNFFEPLSDLLQKKNIKRCYFSPDGVYNQLNVNSIYNPLSQKFLLDEYDFRFVTNSKELVENTDPILTTTSTILIGYPKFNLDNSTAMASAASTGSTTASKTTRGVTRSGNLTRGMRGLLRLMRGDAGISELPGTQREIQQISGLFNNPKVYLEKQATEDVARQVQNPTYLHIATHGYFLEDEAETPNAPKDYVANPLMKAGLILAGAENFIRSGIAVNDAGDDGILTAYEAMNLKLDNTKLVVLSACETGLGQVKNGEGVYGLQRAFKLAGAQSIVMSLWSVDDDATQELMSTFYSELLKTGKQHESFRAAQQKIKEKYPKPFYWGAFIMVGI